MHNTIFLVMPVPFQTHEGRFGFDEQTCDGLVRWAENFDQIILACPVLPRGGGGSSDPTVKSWRAIEELPCADRIELVPLPATYLPHNFAWAYRTTRATIAAVIERSDYLCFGICGIEGDWGAIACLEAIAQNRLYSTWVDRVEYEVIRRTLSRERLRRRLLWAVTLPLMKRYHEYLIKQATLGLFQGKDCYSAYEKIAPNPHCVYDIHTQKSDRISADRLATKLDKIRSNEPLKICYTGRAVEMKGPLDWLKVIHRLVAQGVNVQATWLGDGPLFAEMETLAATLGITDRLTMPGFTNDREVLLGTMQESHLFVFCHKTPESPRCLPESLVSGCPIVGYGSAYTEGLVEQSGGGLFVGRDDWDGLAARIVELDRDRQALASLVEQAARSGLLYDEETVFIHRSDLIKRYLSYDGGLKQPSSPEIVPCHGDVN